MRAICWCKLTKTDVMLSSFENCSVPFCFFLSCRLLWFPQADFSFSSFLLSTYLLIPLWKALSVTFSLWMCSFLFLLLFLTAFALTLKSFLHCFNLRISFTFLFSFFYYFRCVVYFIVPKGLHLFIVPCLWGFANEPLWQEDKQLQQTSERFRLFAVTTQQISANEKLVHPYRFSQKLC